MVRTPWVFEDDPQTFTLPTDDLLAGWDNRYLGGRDIRQQVDLDGDGVPELEFYGTNSALDVLISSHAEILSSHVPLTQADNSTYVIPVIRGDLLGPDALSRYQYQGIPPTLWYGSDAPETHVLGIGFGDPENCGGYFPQQNKPPYVALRFMKNGEWHYAWVQVSSWMDSMGAINGWGWETEPDTPIIVGLIPEPSGFLLVASGSLLLWKRRRH